MKSSLGILASALAVCMLVAPRPMQSAGRHEEATRAELLSLISDARNLSNIRAPGSPPFDLRAKLSVKDTQKQISEGSYELFWQSPERWREEVILPGYRQVKIGGAQRVWVWRNADYPPLQVFGMLQAMDFRAMLTTVGGEEVKRTTKRAADGTTQECYELQKELQGKRRLCFDASRHDLRMATLPTPPFQVVQYMDYSAWSEKQFPRAIRIFADRKLIGEATVEKIASATEADPKLFEPPQGAEERVGCDDPSPAIALEKTAPHYPDVAKMRHVEGVVSAFVVIGVTGGVVNPIIIASGGSDLDNATVQAISHWRYQPSSCGDKPVPSEAIITITYKLSN